MAAASLGRLTLDLAVKLGSFEQGMTQAERKTKDTTEKMGKAFGGFKSQVADALGGTQIGSIVDSFNAKIGSLKGGAMVAGAAFAGMAVGGIAVAFGALSKLAIDTAKADAQLLVLSNRANTSAENFQILQHAASGLGVTQDQLGSILADVQEKLGEFSATQGGGAADFFDALKNNTKMTDDQIKKFGQTLQGKDGVEAVQMLNDKMDELGVTSQERRFVFESLASDLGNLAPLFAEGGLLLDEYGEALKDAGVIKSKEALEQSKILAAQTQSVQTRFEGLKSQLVGQMMPVLSSLVGYFLDGSKKGGQFGGIVQSVGVIARGVAVAIVGVATTIEVLIKLISNFVEQAANIGATAAKVLTADTATERAIALWLGFNTALNGTKATMSDIGGTIERAMTGAMGVIDATAPKLDKLGELYYKTGDAANESAKGLAINTKEADENAKAKERAAKETEKLNKQLQVNAKVQSNAAKYNFAGIEGQYQLPKGLLSAINMQESRGNANAIGPMTKLGQAKGGFQFLDGAAKRFGLIGNAVFDTGKSAEAAAKYFQFLYQKFGTWEKAISAYHAGEGNVERGTGLGPINREYVKNVLGYMDAALKGVGTTASDAIQYVDSVYKSQQSIVLKYLNEQERMELEHAVSIQEIKDAFAENDPSREKYLKLQQLVYQKDVEEFRKAQQDKYASFKRDFANRISNSQNNLELLGVASKYGRDSLVYKTKELDTYTDTSKRENNTLLADSVGRIQDEYSAPDQEKERQELIEDAYKAHKLRLQEIDAEHNEATKGLVVQQASMQLQAFSGLTGSLMGLVDQSSSAYAALYSIQKSFNLAQAIMNGYTAISAAWASAAFPYNLPAVAMATMETGVLQAAISAVSPAGMAHDGIDNIPKEGTWLLDKGERVVDSRTNSDLKNYLKNSSNSSNSGTTVNVNHDPSLAVTTRDDGNGNIDVYVRKIVEDSWNQLSRPNSKQSKLMGQNFNAPRRR